MTTTDLATQIRADLDYRRSKLVDSDDVFAEMAFDGMRAALLAVLELHPTVGPHKGTIYQRLMGDHAESNAACARCGESPCPELLAIAKALGIEVA